MNTILDEIKLSMITLISGLVPLLTGDPDNRHLNPLGGIMLLSPEYMMLLIIDLTIDLMYIFSGLPSQDPRMPDRMQDNSRLPPTSEPTNNAPANQTHNNPQSTSSNSSSGSTSSSSSSESSRSRRRRKKK